MVFLNGSNCECTLEQLPNYKSSGSWLQSKRGILHIFVQLNDVENCARKGKEKKVNGCANLSKQAHLKKIVYNNGILSGTFLLSQFYNPLHLVQ